LRGVQLLEPAGHDLLERHVDSIAPLLELESDPRCIVVALYGHCEVDVPRRARLGAR
jgi:hypothetical protein